MNLPPLRKACRRASRSSSSVAYLGAATDRPPVQSRYEAGVQRPAEIGLKRSLPHSEVCRRPWRRHRRSPLLGHRPPLGGPPCRTGVSWRPHFHCGDFRDGLRLFLQRPAGGAHGGGLFCRIIQVCSEHHRLGGERPEPSVHPPSRAHSKSANPARFHIPGTSLATTKPTRTTTKARRQ